MYISEFLIIYYYLLAELIQGESCFNISITNSKTQKIDFKSKLGFILGLIDGDGHFSSKQQLVIVFHSSDSYLAYYIKERLGFGNVKKVKYKNAFILIIASTEGLEKNS